MSNKIVYQKYNSAVVKCELVRNTDKTCTLVVTHCKVSHETNLLTSSIALQKKFQGKCSVLGVKEVEFHGAYQLFIQIKERPAKKNYHEYHTLFFNDLKKILHTVKTFRLNCDIGRDCFNIALGPVLYFAHDTCLVVVDVKKDSASILKSAFDRKISKLFTASKNEVTKETILLAMVKQPREETATRSELGEFGAYLLKPKPSAEKKDDWTCSKCQSSKFIPNPYTKMITALLHLRCEDAELMVATTNFQQLLQFKDGKLVKCEQLVLNGAQITKILEFENQDNRRICVLKSSQNEVVFTDLLSLKEICRFTNVEVVLVDDFVQQGSEQAMLIHPSRNNEQEVSIVDCATVNIVAHENTRELDEREEYESFGSAVHALNSRLQAGRHSIDAIKLEAQLKETLSFKEVERLNKITACESSNATLDAKMHLVDFFDTEDPMETDTVKESVHTQTEKSVEPGRIWQRTFKGEWIVAVNVKNTTKSDMHSVSMAVVEYGEHGQLQVDPYCSSNRIFIVEPSAESKTVDWISQQTQPDVKKRKVEGQKCLIRTKNNCLLKSDESVVVASVSPVPRMFVSGEKRFKVILFWEFKNHGEAEVTKKRVALQNIHNQCIGNVSIEVQNLWDCQLELASSSISMDTDSYLCLAALQRCTTVDVHTSITDVGHLEELLLEIGMIYLENYGCFIQQRTGPAHLARIQLEKPANKHLRVMHIYTREESDVLQIAHMLYAHAADDLLVLPHKTDNETELVEHALTAMCRETHQQATNLSSLITKAEQEQESDFSSYRTLVKDEDQGDKLMQVKHVRETFQRQKQMLHKTRSADITLCADLLEDKEKLEQKTDCIVQLIGQ